VARDFKSVGVTKSGVTQERAASSALPPIGIVTPVVLDETGSGLLAMHYSLADQIADNLRNLVMTNHGERVGIYDFGANLRPLTLELAQPIWEEEAMTRIKTAVSKYMPFVELGTFETTVLDPATPDGLGRVAVRIVYTVQRVQTRERAIEVILNVAG
jgi:phage baseplate assembly protein W